MGDAGLNRPSEATVTLGAAPAGFGVGAGLPMVAEEREHVDQQHNGITDMASLEKFLEHRAPKIEQAEGSGTPLASRRIPSFSSKIGEREYTGLRRQGTFKLRTVEQQAALDSLTTAIESTPIEETVEPVEITESDEFVQVMVRVRPLTKRERSHGAKSAVQIANGTAVRLSDGKESKEFAFDRVFGVEDKQQAVYKAAMSVSMPKFLAGFHTCIFCYGQTGAGKSWTMLGNNETPEALGLAPRAVHSIFQYIKSQPPTNTITVTVSALEIYNEQLRDLTRMDTDYALHMREAPGKGVFVQNLSEVEVSSVDEVSQLLQNAIDSRAIGSTNMNEESSRSHLVFMLTLSQDDPVRGRRKSKLNLIDLAGSERATATGAVGVRQKEGAAINQSLSCLGNVIHALAQGSKHVPYRNSKLTRLLSNSLGGNCTTKMIVNLSPADINAAESMSSLRFAARAKLIRNKATVNFGANKEDMDKLAAENKELREENARLRAQLAKFEGGGAASSGTDLILPKAMLPHISEGAGAARRRRGSIFSRPHWRRRSVVPPEADQGSSADDAGAGVPAGGRTFQVEDGSSSLAAAAAAAAASDDDGIDRRATQAVILGPGGRRDSQACVIS
eukprot:m.169638 g.169638  ORF g.169638 m.169638 type:complete len:618 (+) comp17810_c4_seq1:92-1945(+)